MCPDPDTVPDALHNAEIETRRALLRLDWENFRYQDGLRWSRIQTTGVIEAAILTGTFAADQHITGSMRFVFVLLLSGLILAIWLLAEKDGRDAGEHHARAKVLEQSLDLPPLIRQPLFPPISGHLTMRASMLLVSALNVMILYDLADGTGWIDKPSRGPPPAIHATPSQVNPSGMTSGPRPG